MIKCLITFLRDSDSLSRTLKESDRAVVDANDFLKNLREKRRELEIRGGGENENQRNENNSEKKTRPPKPPQLSKYAANYNKSQSSFIINSDLNKIDSISRPPRPASSLSIDSGPQQRKANPASTGKGEKSSSFIRKLFKKNKNGEESGIGTKMRKRDKLKKAFLI